MIENNNFPWYLQQSDTFVTLYDGFFGIAESASPLGLGDAFNLDLMRGEMLYRLGTYWGMSGSPYIWDGLIYNLDNWSETKTWTGGLKELGERVYSNLIRAKAYAYGRPYSLETLHGVLESVFSGEQYTVEVNESYMAIEIVITAQQSVLETFIEARAFDLAFIGKPSGIKVTWTYNYL